MTMYMDILLVLPCINKVNINIFPIIAIFQNQPPLQWHRADRAGQLEAALLHRQRRRYIPLHPQLSQDMQTTASRRLQGIDIDLAFTLIHVEGFSGEH